MRSNQQPELIPLVPAGMLARIGFLQCGIAYG